MKQVEQLILLEKNKRQIHIKLSESCIERGGGYAQCRGVLAQYLNTNIPKGYKIQLCHACNNPNCSNPKHLYWGTASENVYDQYVNGRISPAKNRKFGPKSEEWKQRQSIKHKGQIPWNKNISLPGTAMQKLIGENRTEKQKEASKDHSLRMTRKI